MMPWFGQWFVTTDEVLKHEAKTDPAGVEQFLECYQIYQNNPLAYFLAHSGGVDFLNDHDTEVKILTAPCQSGKTYALLAWLGLEIIPTDPNWPCFKENGLVWKKWAGPVHVAVASYSKQALQRNVWPKLREIFPMHELREYSPRFVGRSHRSKQKQPSWGTNPSVLLACGSRIDFYAYNQAASAYEGTTYERWAFDEQVPRGHFDGAFARCTTAEDFRAAMALTAHQLRDRPDTGAGSWIHKMKTGLLEVPFTHKFYTIKMSEVPEPIVSARKKAQYHKKYITIPRQRGIISEINDGYSRWTGEFSSGSGLVYDSWDANIHMVDPFPIPDDWTRVRGLDHGRSEPFSCLWGAMSPWGHLVLYREYYKRGLGIEQNVMNVIQESGNERVLYKNVPGADGRVDAIYQELYTKERYLFSVMDARSLNSPSMRQGLTLQGEYSMAGLNCTPGNAMHNEKAVPIVSRWIEPSEDYRHILVCLKLKKPEEIVDVTGTPIKGAPRLVVFNTLRWFKAEIEGYRNKPETDTPLAKDDHHMTSIRIMVLQQPRYIGGMKPDPIVPAKSNYHAGKFTGYNPYANEVRTGRERVLTFKQ